MFKCIDILYMYIFSILDLKCCSYGCGCRRECRAPDFLTGPQNGKLNKNSYTIFTIWFIYKCMPIYEGDAFICSSVIPPSLKVSYAIATRLKGLTTDVHC